MIGIYGNKQTMPESQKKELFLRRYYLYGKWRICLLPSPVSRRQESLTCRHFYNKALCCYYLSLYNDCRSLLLEAERLLPPLTERLPENLPEAVLRWEYEKSPAGCPMPEDAPDNLAAVQLLRLKAKVSARLHLHTEVRTIHARLGNKYQHIEELIKNIQP